MHVEYRGGEGKEKPPHKSKEEKGKFLARRGGSIPTKRILFTIIEKEGSALGQIGEFLGSEVMSFSIEQEKGQTTKKEEKNNPQN